MIPKISVIMPVYNSEMFVAKAIESILSQDYNNFEFIIINDGSTDNSYKIITSYNDSRIVVINQNNSGVAVSLNRGIAIAKADIIARQDADDISYHDRLSKQLEYLEKNPDIYLLGTNALLVDRNGKKIKALDFNGTDGELKRTILDFNPFIHGSVMLRKEALRNVGMYREQFALCQSYDLWLRICEKYNIGVLNECLYEYRVWSDAISYKNVALNNTMKRIIIEYAKQRKKFGFDELMKNNFLFYEKYSKQIIESYKKTDEYRLLKGIEQHNLFEL